jgi:hypothetical protein
MKSYFWIVLGAVFSFVLGMFAFPQPSGVETKTLTTLDARYAQSNTENILMSD